jgi:hypothetical protein
VAQVAHVNVKLSDVQPVARFIAAVCRADAMTRSMTKAEAAALPETVAAGVAGLQSAVRSLGVLRDPDYDAGGVLPAGSVRVRNDTGEPEEVQD